MRKLVVTVSVVVICLALVITGCPAPTDKVVTVGNKGFAEQFIIGQVIKQLLEDHGFTVELKSGRSTECLIVGKFSLTILAPITLDTFKSAEFDYIVRPTILTFCHVSNIPLYSLQFQIISDSLCSGYYFHTPNYLSHLW